MVIDVNILPPSQIDVTIQVAPPNIIEVTTEVISPQKTDIDIIIAQPENIDVVVEVQPVNEINIDIIISDQPDTHLIGSLPDLETQTKINVVAAINEVNNKAIGYRSFEAGETFGGGRLLIISNGKVYKFNASNEQENEREIGFSLSSAIQGDIVSVKNFGQIEIGSLIPDAIYYANDDGLISINPVASGTMLKVGIAIDNQFLEIKFSQSIII